MKCLIINGSPSKSYTWNGTETSGFTSKLTEQICNALALMGEVEFAEIRLIDVAIPTCLGCYQCFEKGEQTCPHFSCISPIIERMREADCVIMTSPVYALNVSGLLKNFIDHGAYTYHRPEYWGKKAIVISTAVGGYAGKVCDYMAETLKHWGFDRVYKLPVVRHGMNNLSIQLTSRCHRVAEQVYEDIVTKRVYPPSLKRVFFYNLWRTLNTADTALPADRAYWEKCGLDKGVYAPGFRLNPFSKFFGVLMTGILKNFVGGKSG